MRFSAPYTRAILRRSYYSKGHNFTSVLLSRVVTTNAKCLRPRYLPSLQPANILSVNIPSADIPSADILFIDIPSAS